MKPSLPCRIKAAPGEIVCLGESLPREETSHLLISNNDGRRRVSAGVEKEHTGGGSRCDGSSPPRTADAGREARAEPQTSGRTAPPLSCAFHPRGRSPRGSGGSRDLRTAVAAPRSVGDSDVLCRLMGGQDVPASVTAATRIVVTVVVLDVTDSTITHRHETELSDRCHTLGATRSARVPRSSVLCATSSQPAMCGRAPKHAARPFLACRMKNASARQDGHNSPSASRSRSSRGRAAYCAAE